MTPVYRARSGGTRLRGSARTSRGFPSQTHGVSTVKGDQDSPRAGAAIEHLGGEALLIGPGVGVDDGEILRIEAQRLVAAGTVGGQPGELAQVVDAIRGAGGKKIAA